ncbi:hypothetical protein D8Y20_13340 [Mariprofundus sp. EBB-1]|uniref:hypothetical protein n=1 Tax=Mariprofundus sp. EBB-1 TaxID=2650971 RepID=UPI000EF1C58C|nr:hypothetical protein [Mariprofundus sp. EBB-1]RLL49114.1 hypothetical protein D8Y20_13340 [Mariprofundus sp. EBB-1]
MVTLIQIMEHVNARMSRVLLMAESSLPEAQFRAYRKLVLDEFGKRGLGKELEDLFDQQERKG